MNDLINHPPHYTAHPSGIECIQVAEHMSFNLGNAIKYIWRADEKGDAIEDLRKAAWYIQREIERRQPAAAQHDDPHFDNDHGCWCNCLACTTTNGRCICPTCSGTSCVSHEDRRAVSA